MLAMPFWYFFKIPQLPPAVSHQSNQVELQKYLCAEGDAVEVGTPLAMIENYWAVMRLNANGKGIVRKIFFAAHSQVNVGDPIAIIDADGEEIPYSDAYSLLEVIKEKRPKKEIAPCR
jgi:pyruvate/2-oxoglutarate dehydrogenase complex dihydrolipoamide acyltransferase (E2) component